MKLSTTTPWISLLEAAALLTIVLFALDAVQLHQVAASQSASSITTLALLLSLISLVCLTAAVGFAVLRITHTILFGSADIVSVCRRFTRLSNLLIPALCICYMILLRMGPGIGLSHALSAFIAGLLICIGIAQMPGLTSLVWRWKRWSNEHYSGAALIQLTCYLLATLKLQTTLHSFPHLQIAIQFGLLMGLIGLTAYAIEQRAQMFDHGVLTLCLSLQVGCLIGLTVKPPNAPSQLIPIEFSSATARAALRTLRWGLDKDGDGFSTHLGGGDCDDNDPRVHPHAPEIPGNGIDDNCLAGDAPAPVVNTVNKRPQPQPQISKRASVVLIVIDSLRSDRVLYDGHARNTAPQLSQWSRQSTRFLKAFAQAPHTPRSIPSMMTGKYPSRLNWVSSFENYPTPHRNENFIAEEFFEHGYTTVAVSSHWYFSRVPEVLRGFERRRSLVQTYRESTDARETTDIALEELTRLTDDDDAFFMLVHYIDPHEPYTTKGKSPVFGTRRMSDRYDNEVHFMDQHLGRLLTQLTELQTQEDLFVIVTSDHGEAFREHGLLFHGRTLYNEEIRVPLFIRGPSLPATDVLTPVGLIDLAPTIRSLVGLPVQSTDGIDLTHLAHDREKHRASPLYSELLPYPRYNQHRLATISRDGRWKLIRNLTRHTIEMFDLSRDPREKNNRFSASHPTGQRLKNELERFVDGRTTRPGNTRTVDQSDHRAPVRLRQAVERKSDHSTL